MVVVLIPFMSGKIGYVVAATLNRKTLVLIPFMSGKIGYYERSAPQVIIGSLNPFYVREDWLLPMS